MIKVCLADNYPAIHQGIKSYFKNHPEISIVANVNKFSMVTELLKTKDIDVLILDLELEELSSIFEIKTILTKHPTTKIIIFSGLSEQIYAPNAIKAGVSGYVHKTEKLENLGKVIVKVNQGEIIMNETIKTNLSLIAKQNKGERLHRKLSNREVEVLRYLSAGKKNNEIAEILSLDEKTISTYKLRLLIKLNVTNLVDLVNKAKIIEAI
ncbi:response regulator transcription factor [Flavobacterium frigoris]|uniref:Regulatory protein, LuxR:Response regulator receiver n=1 Tax=Flavobacterium frigoris (strain PS1) TaxID=1086011 RepID=H7FQV3_FLAFP|nr:response regulator transcription factor [Flavobacterium frigoris]EIA09090.1 regulatory protein, LuxR:Response regulator receiver [Flavobacterium frigoris PS1]